MIEAKEDRAMILRCAGPRPLLEEADELGGSQPNTEAAFYHRDQGRVLLTNFILCIITLYYQTSYQILSILTNYADYACKYTHFVQSLTTPVHANRIISYQTIQLRGFIAMHRYFVIKGNIQCAAIVLTYELTNTWYAMIMTQMKKTVPVRAIAKTSCQDWPLYPLAWAQIA